MSTSGRNSLLAHRSALPNPFQSDASSADIKEVSFKKKPQITPRRITANHSNKISNKTTNNTLYRKFRNEESKLKMDIANLKDEISFLNEELENKLVGFSYIELASLFYPGKFPHPKNSKSDFVEDKNSEYNKLDKNIDKLEEIFDSESIFRFDKSNRHQKNVIQDMKKEMEETDEQLKEIREKISQIKNSQLYKDIHEQRDEIKNKHKQIHKVVVVHRNLKNEMRSLENDIDDIDQLQYILNSTNHTLEKHTKKYQQMREKQKKEEKVAREIYEKRKRIQISPILQSINREEKKRLYMSQSIVAQNIFDESEDEMKENNNSIEINLSRQELSIERWTNPILEEKINKPYDISNQSHIPKENELNHGKYEQTNEEDDNHGRIENQKDENKTEENQLEEYKKEENEEFNQNSNCSNQTKIKKVLNKDENDKESQKDKGEINSKLWSYIQENDIQIDSDFAFANQFLSENEEEEDTTTQFIKNNTKLSELSENHPGTSTETSIHSKVQSENENTKSERIDLSKETSSENNKESNKYEPNKDSKKERKGNEEKVDQVTANEDKQVQIEEGQIEKEVMERYLQENHNETPGEPTQFVMKTNKQNAQTIQNKKETNENICHIEKNTQNEKERNENEGNETEVNKNLKSENINQCSEDEKIKSSVDIQCEITERKHDAPSFFYPPESPEDSTSMAYSESDFSSATIKKHKHVKNISLKSKSNKQNHFNNLNFKPFNDSNNDSEENENRSRNDENANHELNIDESDSTSIFNSSDNISQSNIDTGKPPKKKDSKNDNFNNSKIDSDDSTSIACSEADFDLTIVKKNTIVVGSKSKEAPIILKNSPTQSYEQSRPYNQSQSENDSASLKSDAIPSLISPIQPRTINFNDINTIEKNINKVPDNNHIIVNHVDGKVYQDSDFLPTTSEYASDESEPLTIGIFSRPDKNSDAESSSKILDTNDNGESTTIVYSESSIHSKIEKEIKLQQDIQLNFQKFSDDDSNKDASSSTTHLVDLNQHSPTRDDLAVDKQVFYYETNTHSNLDSDSTSVIKSSSHLSERRLPSARSNISNRRTNKNNYNFSDKYYSDTTENIELKFIVGDERRCLRVGKFETKPSKKTIMPYFISFGSIESYFPAKINNLYEVFITFKKHDAAKNAKKQLKGPKVAGTRLKIEWDSSDNDSNYLNDQLNRKENNDDLMESVSMSSDNQGENNLTKSQTHEKRKLYFFSMS
ncbi:hypothetical protein TRFO_29269 [Tritrichomonas foetus]|uniref:RRM domain-containing protein n=1 Tax=Tritrichomonas foetus TaxID=1144522 RepID=A0A1J4K0S8_9EUKA|nr:hypothetical protein TRFO_29269 [Tritrichomonas foetus]|eukprot:OHT03348.1 hypothetical protein TRFO_29269 [Tritrichomonas foetus]